jgi:hypothetical protein
MGKIEGNLEELIVFRWSIKRILSENQSGNYYFPVKLEQGIFRSRGHFLLRSDLVKQRGHPAFFKFLHSRVSVYPHWSNAPVSEFLSI